MGHGAPLPVLYNFTMAEKNHRATAGFYILAYFKLHLELNFQEAKFCSRKRFLKFLNDSVWINDKLKVINLGKK